MKKKKLAMFFPGNQYKVYGPLFYYAQLILVKKGYEVISISYDDVIECEENWISDIRNNAVSMIRNAAEDDYEDIMLVSKSIGSVIAGEVSHELAGEYPVRNIFLSPLKGTLPYIASEECIVIAGGKDRLLAAEELLDYCRENHKPLYHFDDAGHAIVVREDPLRSVDIQREIAEIMDSYIG